MIHLMSTLSGEFEDNTQILNMILLACHNNGHHVLNYTEHTFHPYGYTAVALLSESHFAIHTYPELNKCYVDLFSCNPDLDKCKAVVENFAGYMGSVITESYIHRR